MRSLLPTRDPAKTDEAQRGAVLFLVAITTFIVMIAGAIAVDLSALATRGQSLQNAADSAALAGVQAYRQSMGDRSEATAVDREAARDAVRRTLAQNGIEDLEPVIEFTDPENHTEVRVTISDDDAGLLLSEFTNSAGTVERAATARFERCESGCVKEVAIPPPFVDIDTTGDGDGYKPIPVGDNLYSINHQSGGGGGRGTWQITCVQRDQEYCWDTAGVLAYPSGYIPHKTPEMPHAAVVGSRIFWASSTATGHYMFCFETETGSPCAQPLRLNDSRQATNLPDRLIHRGGGTVEEDGLVYSFTDDHMVHCVVPTYPMQMCAGYPRKSSLGEAGMEPADPSIGNSGSSIDRIVDGTSGRIYSTLHVDAVEDDLRCPNNDPNNRNPRGEVVLKNASSQLYIGLNPALTEVIDSADATDPYAQWEVLTGTTRGRNGSRWYVWRNVGAHRSGFTRYLVADEDNWGRALDIADHGDDGVYFVLDYDGLTSKIETLFETRDPSNRSNRQFLREDTTTGPGGIDYEFSAGDYAAAQADWIIRPWQCEVVGPGGGSGAAGSGILWQPGTWLNCFDTVADSACAGFRPARIHADWDSFSGRLFFYRDGSGNPLGVCSTGFDQHWDWYSNMATSTEVSCVDQVTGAEAPALELGMVAFRNTLALFNTGNTNGSGARWGTWGDPHWNDHTNRMFYPTHRTQSRVICWDWDTGTLCPENASIQGMSAEHGETQDYGFFSEGNCVYALGHTAIFWAFRADNINERCNGSSKTTSISPCNCGGTLYWGAIGFDITEDQFEEFDIVVVDDNGDQVYPTPDDPNFPDDVHSIFEHGDTIDLNHIPANDRNQQLWIEVNVVAKQGVDPWAEGDGSQTFTIEINRSPRLTD